MAWLLMSFEKRKASNSITKNEAGDMRRIT